MECIMSRCRQCEVEIMDDTQICPLCKNVIEKDEDAKNGYPNIRFRVKSLQIIVRIYLVAAIVLELLLVYLNWKYNNGVWWSAITGAGLAYLYFVARFAILNNHAGYRSKFLLLTLFAVIYVILIDYVVGYLGWSVNYVVPGGILFVDACILLIMCMNHRNWQSYIILEIAMIFISGIPVILALFGIVAKPFVSSLAFLLTVMMFFGTLIIGDKRARTELKRRFHIR